jgi:xylulokinase
VGAAELLGIDLGTSSVKVGVFARDGAMRGYARRPLHTDFRADGGAEADPEAWWSATADAVREATAEIDMRQLKAACVGGQGPTLVLVDTAGRPVRAAITWGDTRCAAHSAQLVEKLGSDRAGYSLVPRLAWVAETEPDVLERARWALQPWDFLTGRLAGGQVGVVSTFAGDRVWRDEWLAAAGFAGSPLIPPPVDAGCPYAETGGDWAAQVGLPPGIKLVGGMNDAMGSIVGADGAVVGRAIDPGGVAGGFALTCDRPLSAPGIDAWPGLMGGTYIVGGAFAAGGRAMDWWADIGAAGSLETALDLAAAAPPGAGGLVCLPFLAGERAPLWDPSARGAILGLTLEHGPRHLARAVLEGTAYELRLMTDTVLAAGARIDDLRLCGGQAQSRVWNQIKADVTGLVCSVPRVAEAAVMGNAVCAALGAGLYPDLGSASAAMVSPGYTLEPNAATRSVYDRLFGVYRDAYSALRPFNTRLS